jgi:hypothetical protein
MPTTRVVRCSLRATSRPNLPQIPVIKTAMWAYLSNVPMPMPVPVPEISDEIGQGQGHV